MFITSSTFSFDVPNQMMDRVDQEKARTVELWMKRATLEEQLFLEKTLKDLIKTAKFECPTHDFDTILSKRLPNQPLIDTFLKLLKEERCLNARIEELNQRSELEKGFETIASITNEIERLRKENELLSTENDELAVEIATFDDPEMHLLLAELQHLQLQRMKTK